MKSFIIRLTDFEDSMKWAEDAYNSGIEHNWDIHYFDGFNGSKYSLDDFNLFKSKAKKATAFNRKGVVGCFLSHYHLWIKCVNLNEPLCILEHDITIHKKFPKINLSETDVYRLAINRVGKPIRKPIKLGEWWAGAMAYIVTPLGASKLIEFAKTSGVLPADVMLATNIVRVSLHNPLNTVVTFKHASENGNYSFTADFI